MTYKVYGMVQSRAFRVLWLLEELGLDYEHVPAGPHSAEIKSVSALGKVPALVDGDTVITDSSAILTYLADKHGAFTAPAGSKARARQDSWTFRILDEIESQLWTASKHSFVLPEAERVAEVKPSCKAEYARNLERIMAELEGDYLMGDAFSVPDIILGHCGGWARNAGFPDGPDAFGAYLKRLRARSAFRAAVSAGQKG